MSIDQACLKRKCFSSQAIAKVQLTRPTRCSVFFVWNLFSFLLYFHVNCQLAFLFAFCFWNQYLQTASNKRGKPSSSSSQMEHKLYLVGLRLAMLQDSDSDGGVCETKEENCRDPSSSSISNGEAAVHDPLEEEEEDDDSSQLVLTQQQQLLVAAATSTPPNSHPIRNHVLNPKKQRKQKIESRSCESSPSSPSGKSRTLVMKQAEKLQLKLMAHKFPTFIKYMLRSHVTRGFWLGLPKQFCDKNLPKCVSVIINLIDENGKKYKSKYLGNKVGLSGGWRGFSVAHNIQEGDAVVFQLIGPTTFKVYVIRRRRIRRRKTTGLVLGGGQLDLYACADHKVAPPQSPQDNIHDHAAPALDDRHEEEESIMMQNENSSRENNPSPAGNSSAATGLLLDGIRLAEEDSTISFPQVRTFDDFNITANGLIIDCKFTHHIRNKYYHLCCSQNSFLHENLLKGLNSTLIVGIINETVNIADAVAVRPSRSAAAADHDDLVTWDKTLQGFEVLGMKVGFLRARISQLILQRAPHPPPAAAENNNDNNNYGIILKTLKMMERTKVKSGEMRQQQQSYSH